MESVDFSVIDAEGKVQAHLDPYLICPAGRESECISRHKREFRQDLKAGSTYGAPAQPFDSGGQG